jgi:site-specific DNA-methyltransferase (adenine-specific)
MENKFILGDCMDKETGLPSYPDNYFDLAIVDPPYGIGESGKDKQNQSKLGKGKKWQPKRLGY